jgi:hypothetical protein
MSIFTFSYSTFQISSSNPLASGALPAKRWELELRVHNVIAQIPDSF